jgi:hypothetical protein
MAETIGALILEATIGAEAVSSFAASIGISVGAVNTVVGAAAIVGASIGLQYALYNPKIPRPEDGSQALKQAIPSRIKGYGVNRIAGNYMLYEAADSGGPPATSYDVIALHHGRIDSFVGFFLSDDLVTVSPSIASGGAGVVQDTFNDGRYGDGRVTIQTRLGLVGQSVITFASDPAINGYWTGQHVGNGIAYAAMACAGPGDPSEFTKRFPRGHPELSVIAKCSPIWDPRDPTQDRLNPATWKLSYNPVLQLIDYLTQAEGGLGLELDEILPPAQLAAWMAEADICDEVVATGGGGSERRFQSHGWYRFDTSPDEVINAILSTCDGWLAESGDGSLSLTVGLYRAPSGPSLTERHILGFQLNYGTADEELINVLDVSFTDPENKYVEVQLGSWRDEESISQAGIERAKQLSLKWVQSSSQASRLADRAMQRVNPILSGSFVTTLYGLRYLGKRWIPIQYPFVSGLQDSIVEIQNAEVDLLKGRISWDFILIAPSQIEAYDPDADELPSPTVPPTGSPNLIKREDGTPLAREDGSAFVRES